MCGPPDPEMRNRPAANGTAYRIEVNSTDIDSKPLADLQASRLSRLYALSWYTANTIARLAYGVSR